MNVKKILPVISGWAVAFLVSAGAVGCLVTGFGLTVEHRGALLILCCVSSLVCSAAFSWKHGTALVLCLGALGAALL